MVSCHSTDLTTKRGAKGDEDAANVKLETFDFTLNSTNMTHFAYGIAANVVAVLLYGSNFVPIKRIETGDGMFFQWVNCAAIWVVSMVGDLMLQSPKFHPFAMLGGVIWATGNITVVPIVKAVGLGLGVLIWGSSSLLMGWATSRFGLFGIAAQDVSRPILNYCGAGLCLLSGLIFFFVKTDVELHPNTESIPLLIDRRLNSGSYGPSSSEFWIDVVGPKTRRFIGCLLAVVSGLLYGSSFVPMLYIKTRSSCQDSVFHGASVYDLDYVYAQCSGIFVASTVYFAIYCAAMHNRPRIYSRVILPGLLSGMMWALATYCWFLANNYLSAVITFPIVSAGYGLVAALWGCLVFREVKGLTNCFIFLLASCVVLTGSLLSAISKL
ncbi:transmembrane protein 144b [Pempheris klunzingeri]|uniref:transmembrane protein 144b n=1 Tax=Pempheris klunzingeri TaxID=3127111 RepID=UPI003980F3AB